MIFTEKEPRFGDIIRTRVRFYYHYGIYVSDDQVIQFGLPDNVTTPSHLIRVLSTDVYTFLNGGTVEVAQPDRAERKKMRPAKEAVAVAQSRIGETGYDILHNNCEHFVNECVFGEHRCSFLEAAREQVRQKLGK